MLSSFPNLNVPVDCMVDSPPLAMAWYDCHNSPSYSLGVMYGSEGVQETLEVKDRGSPVVKSTRAIHIKHITMITDHSNAFDKLEELMIKKPFRMINGSKREEGIKILGLVYFTRDKPKEYLPRIVINIVSEFWRKGGMVDGPLYLEMHVKEEDFVINQYFTLFRLQCTKQIKQFIPRALMQSGKYLNGAAAVIKEELSASKGEILPLRIYTMDKTSDEGNFDDNIRGGIDDMELPESMKRLLPDTKAMFETQVQKLRDVIAKINIQHRHHKEDIDPESSSCDVSTDDAIYPNAVDDVTIGNRSLLAESPLFTPIQPEELDSARSSGVPLFHSPITHIGIVRDSAVDPLTESDFEQELEADAMAYPAGIELRNETPILHSDLAISDDLVLELESPMAMHSEIEFEDDILYSNQRGVNGVGEGIWREQKSMQNHSLQLNNIHEPNDESFDQDFDMVLAEESGALKPATAPGFAFVESYDSLPTDYFPSNPPVNNGYDSWGHNSVAEEDVLDFVDSTPSNVPVRSRPNKLNVAQEELEDLKDINVEDFNEPTSSYRLPNLQHRKEKKPSLLPYIPPSKRNNK